MLPAPSPFLQAKSRLLSRLQTHTNSLLSAEKARQEKELARLQKIWDSEFSSISLTPLEEANLNEICLANWRSEEEERRNELEEEVGRRREEVERRMREEERRRREEGRRRVEEERMRVEEEGRRVEEEWRSREEERWRREEENERRKEEEWREEGWRRKTEEEGKKRMDEESWMVEEGNPYLEQMEEQEEEGALVELRDRLEDLSQEINDKENQLKKERHFQSDLKRKLTNLKARLEDSLVQHETSDLDEIMSQLKSHIFLKEKSLNDSKMMINKGAKEVNQKGRGIYQDKRREESENFSDDLKENCKMRNDSDINKGKYDDDSYEFCKENKRNGGRIVNSINDEGNDNFKLGRDKRKNHGKSVDYRKPFEKSNKRKNNEDNESDFIHFTSNNPQTEESDGQSSRKYFESSREIEFFVSSDCA